VCQGTDEHPMDLLSALYVCAKFLRSGSTDVSALELPYGLVSYSQCSHVFKNHCIPISNNDARSWAA
jgi:hypothetical protein